MESKQVATLVKTESRMVVTRGWGKEELGNCCLRTNLQLVEI